MKHLPLKIDGLPIGSPPSLFLEHVVAVAEGRVSLEFEAYEHRALRGTLRKITGRRCTSLPITTRSR